MLARRVVEEDTLVWERYVAARGKPECCARGSAPISRLFNRPRYEQLLAEASNARLERLRARSKAPLVFPKWWFDGGAFTVAPAARGATREQSPSASTWLHPADALRNPPKPSRIATRKGSVDAAVARSISYTYWRAHPELACVEPGYADVRAIFEEEDQGCEHGEAGTAGSAAPERDTGGRAAARRMSG